MLGILAGVMLMSVREELSNVMDIEYTYKSLTLVSPAE